MLFDGIVSLSDASAGTGGKIDSEWLGSTYCWYYGCSIASSPEHTLFTFTYKELLMQS